MSSFHPLRALVSRRGSAAVEPDLFDDLRDSSGAPESDGGDDPPAISGYGDRSVRADDAAMYDDLATPHLELEALTRAARVVDPDHSDDVID